MVAAFSLFLISTDPGNLMSELIHAGLPPAIAYVVMASLMIVPEMSHKASTILEAQRARGLRTSGSLLQRTRAVFPLVAPLLLGTLMIAEERAHCAGSSRLQHPAPSHFWEEIADSQGQRGFRGSAHHRHHHRWGAAVAIIELHHFSTPIQPAPTPR